MAACGFSSGEPTDFKSRVYKVMPEAPPNGTRAVWYIQNGRIGVFGHWQDGELVEDRRMTWIQTQGGGSTAVGLLRVFFRWFLNVGILLALLYALVWFVQRAWTADVPQQHSLNRTETLRLIRQ